MPAKKLLMPSSLKTDKKNKHSAQTYLVWNHAVKMDVLNGAIGIFLHNKDNILILKKTAFQHFHTSILMITDGHSQHGHRSTKVPDPLPDLETVKIRHLDNNKYKATLNI